MQPKEAFEKLETIFDDMRETDDYVIAAARQLKTILLNLLIEDARIKENTGIVPLAADLRKLIDGINNNVTNLVTTHRLEVPGVLNTIKEVIERTGEHGE